MNPDACVYRLAEVGSRGGANYTIKNFAYRPAGAGPAGGGCEWHYKIFLPIGRPRGAGPAGERMAL